MNTFSAGKLSVARVWLAISPLFLLPALSPAQVAWDGGGGDNNWSTIGNWNPDGSPSAQAVTFGNTDAASDASTVNSIVNNNTVDPTYMWTLNSLTFNNTGASVYQNLQINSGVTLKLDAAGAATGTILNVGGADGVAISTKASIRGSGSFVIDEPTANVNVGNTNTATGVLSSATLDLSGLSNFSATVNNFRVGYGNRSQGIVSLAGANFIKAATVVVGSSNNDFSGTSATSQLNLGLANSIFTDNIYVGSTVANSTKNSLSGTVQFQTFAPGANPTVTIRGQNSTELAPTRANLIIGRTTTTSSSTANYSNTSSVDFRGGSVDALLNSVIVGNGGADNNSPVNASLSMNAGTINANIVQLGVSGGNGGDNVNGVTSGTLNVGGGSFTTTDLYVGFNSSKAMRAAGTLNVSGGTFTVTNGISLTRRNFTASGSATSVLGTINLTGGSLSVGGDIAPGGSAISSSNMTSTLKVSGGSLNMNGHNIAVDTFTVESGTISNVGGLYQDDGVTIRGLTKTTSGTLILTGTNNYAGPTTVSLGNLTVNGTLTNSSVTAATTTRVAGNGSIGGALTMQSGSILATGDGGIGTLTAGSLVWNDSATFEFALSNSNNTSDRISLDTAFTMGTDGVFLFDFLNTGRTGGTYTLATFATTTFTNASQFSYQNLGSGLSGDFVLNANSLVFAIVPEPSTWTLLALAGGVVLILRRRRRIVG